MEAFVNLTSIIPPLEEKFHAFKDFQSRISQMFNLQNQYIKMVHIMLNFIRAERIGDWELHLEAVTHMLPYVFAYDRTNYSRWISVYLIDMRNLKYTAPEVYQEFQSGNHPVKRSDNSTFNQVWTDMGLEQSLNRDSKTSGGIVGLQGAVDRWFLTAHEKSSITAATKIMCGIEEQDEEYGHKEQWRIGTYNFVVPGLSQPLV